MAEHLKHKSIKLFLIEDQPFEVTLIEKRLEKNNEYNFEFEICDTLEAAISRLKSNPSDIILLDLFLKDSQGIETFKKMQDEFPDIPVIILTAFDDKISAVEAIRSGAQDYLIKGEYDIKLLYRTVVYAIERNKIKMRLEKTNRTLNNMLTVEPVTGLLNRRGLQKSLSDTILKMRRIGSSAHACLIDLDNFKDINDLYGHTIGDMVLKQIGERVQAALRSTDHVARVGGDELIVIMPDTNAASARKVAEKTRLALGRTAIGLAGGKAIHVTVSIGVMELPDHPVSVDDLIDKLFELLRKIKGSKGNIVTFGDLKNPEKGLQDPVISKVLDMLNAGEKLYAVGQPLFRLRDQKKIGYEMLSRLPLVEFGLPDDFFRLAMESKILTLVDRFCLRKCVRTAAQLKSEQSIHVNLFPSTIIDVPIEELIAEFDGIDKDKSFCIEISEHQIIGDPGYLKNAIREFKRQGLLVAVDDVGFGHSCLESLILLEPDIVKIDRKYIQNIDHESGKQRSMKRLLKMVNSIDAIAYAEGIETQPELDTCIDLGIQFGQGYLLGKPSKDIS